MSSRLRASLLLAGVGVLGLACAEYIAAPGERVPRGLLLDSLQYTVDEGQKLNLVATVLDQLGAPFDTLPAGVAIAWSSADTTVARVDTAGVLSGIGAGATQVNAAASGAFGAFNVSAPVTVRPLVNAITAVAGDAQSGTVGQTLPTRLQVRVTNRLGAGVGRIAVNFAVVGVAGGSLDTASTTTDSTGLASAGFTLGTKAGTDSVHVSTPRLAGTMVTFIAQATPGPISALAKVSGDSQTAGARTALPAPLVVLALDRYANPVPGDTVVWAVTAGGGAIAPDTARTDAQGSSSATWTLGAVGAQSATATVGGALTVTFGATAVARVASVTVAPASFALSSGSSQQLTATPKDSAGNAIAGRTVTWTTSDATVAAVSVSGLVTTAKVGAATVTATVDGVAGASSVTVTPGPASTATSQVGVSAPTVRAGDSATFTLTTRDAAGNALTSGGLTVAFTMSGGTSAGSIGAVADKANGSYAAVFRATTAGTPVTVGATIGAQPVTSTLPTLQVVADTVVTSVTVAPPLATVAAGSTQQFVDTAKNAAGVPLFGKPVTWTTSDSTVATVGAAGLVTGVKAGTATVTATVQGVAATVTITVIPGPPSTAKSYVALSATTVTVGGTVTLKLTTRDAAGDSLTTGGHTVTFTQSGGTSAGTIGPVADNGNGTYAATFTATTAGTPVAIGATIDGHAVTSAGPPPTIQVNAAPSTLVHWANAASGQWATAANWSPARVPTLQDTAVVDAAGTYQVSSAGDSVGGLVIGTSAGSPASVLFTGASKVRGSVEVRAGADLDAAATVIVGAFRNDGEIDVESGAALAVDTTGAATAQNYGALYLNDSSVLNVNRAPAGFVNHGLLNPGGPPVEGALIVGLATIAGNVTLGSGSVVNIELRGATFRQYSVLGITGAATLGDTLRVQLSGGFVPSAGQTFFVLTWTSFSGTFSSLHLPTLTGGQWQVSYTPIGLMLSVVAGPAAGVSAWQGDGQSAAAGSVLPTAPAVRVTDAGGNGVAGQSVTFAVTSGGGSVVAPATVTTDANGVATASGWQLGSSPGTNTLTATVAASGLAGNPVTFTATGTAPSLSWTGAISADWSNANNWSPALTPGANNAVTIGPATNQPTLTGASAALSVTIQGSGAVLRIGSQTLTTGALTTNSDGVLIMTDPADLVIVSGAVNFFGGNETGGLTAGELRVGGNFYQGIVTSNASFAASGTFKTVMNGTTLQSVQFVDLTGASHFQDLDISASAGINIQFDFNGLVVKGTLTSRPTGASTPMLYGLGRSLTARQVQVSRLVVDYAPLIVNEGGTELSQQLDSVTFQDFRLLNGTAPLTQLTLVLQGGSPSDRLLTFNALTFTPMDVGDTGFYLSLTSNGGSTALTVNGSNITNGPAFTQTSANATVTWQ